VTGLVFEIALRILPSILDVVVPTCNIDFTPDTGLPSDQDIVYNLAERILAV